MDTDSFYKIIALLLLVAGSAFFSGSEVALFSLNRKKLELNFSKNRIVSRYLKYLLDFPRRLLVTILIGNTLVNVGASIVAVTIALNYASETGLSPDLAITIQILLLTLLILVFGELLPKVVASKNPIRFSKFVTIPIYWCSVVLFPISEMLTELIRLSVSRVTFDKLKSAISQHELKELAAISEEHGALEESEQEIIHSLVGFRHVTVNEVMTPRVDMISVSTDSSLDDVIETIKQTGHSRIPLYREDLDEIVGIIYAKDILKLMRSSANDEEVKLRRIARKALFVPKSKFISELMKEFQQKKTHIAVVVDEYGGTAGLITLEDIIEEVIGEIWDEYDIEENHISKIDDKKFLILGKISIDELKNEIGLNIENEDEDFETLGGFVLNHAGLIPKEDYTFEKNGYRFTVKEILKKRVKKVLVEKIEPDETNG